MLLQNKQGTSDIEEPNLVTLLNMPDAVVNVCAVTNKFKF